MRSMIAVFCWADVLFFRSRQMFRTMSGPGFRGLAPFAACTRCSAEKNHGGSPLLSFDGFWLTVKFPWNDGVSLLRSKVSQPVSTLNAHAVKLGRTCERE